jgi:hypothetical protein
VPTVVTTVAEESFSGPVFPEIEEFYPAAAQQQLLMKVHCCDVPGHAHEKARFSNVLMTSYTAFWGALGCSCFAFSKSGRTPAEHDDWF